MFGDFMLLEELGQARRAARLPLGDTGGRDEAWLRDTLFAHSEILPIRDLDPAFGPLIPLCRELRTEAGPLDLCFINTDGRLTLVECKLWRNAESRRKVVAQVIDYARAIARWSYSDLRRQVSMATGLKGNVPYELARATDPSLEEHRFADAVTRGMRSGRFLLLIAGDGIREDIGAMADLVNRNAASAFELGLVEVALYDLAGEGLAIQPRVLAKTHLLERTVVVLRGEADSILRDEVLEVVADAAPSPAREPGQESPKQALYRAWWAPVVAMTFDDPDQEPPALRWPNNVRVSLPLQGLWLTGYRSGEGSSERLGVFLAGKEQDVAAIWGLISQEITDSASALPDGITVGDGRSPLKVERAGSDFPDEDAKRQWFIETLNQMVNVLRPAVKRADEMASA